MKKQKEMHTFKILVVCIVITGLIYSGLFFTFIIYPRIIYPAYLSTVDNCLAESSEKILNNSGYFVAGEFSVDTETNETKIVVYLNDSRYEKIYRHELCHKRQYKEGRLFNCKFGGALSFLNEVECYIYSQ